MCDCYYQKCEFCDNEISIHIADFCVERKDIEVICPDCVKYKERGIYTGFYKLMFAGIIKDRNQVNGKLKNGRYKGKLVIMFSKDVDAYGVHLN